MNIGVQFYTIRDFCKNLEDFSESLKKVAEIGYKYVQISGTCDYEPEWLDEQLKLNGLKCVITHSPVDKMKENPKKVCDNHTVFGCNNIGIGYYDFKTAEGDDAYEQFVKNYKPVAKEFKDNGKFLMYHNHDMEFFKYPDGRLVIERLMEDFSADELGFTLDTFWVQAAGGDPAQWIEKLSGRVPCIHLKDFAYGKKMSVIGEGNINFERVFAAAEKSGTEYMLVEQDECNGEDPFDCLKRSYDYLCSFGYR